MFLGATPLLYGNSSIVPPHTSQPGRDQPPSPVPLTPGVHGCCRAGVTRLVKDTAEVEVSNFSVPVLVNLALDQAVQAVACIVSNVLNRAWQEA